MFRLIFGLQNLKVFISGFIYQKTENWIQGGVLCSVLEILKFLPVLTDELLLY